MRDQVQAEPKPSSLLLLTIAVFFTGRETRPFQTSRSHRIFLQNLSQRKRF
ncbi:hypothetical protein AB9F35_17965 [Rhizobium leguminosarum]|uniref:hypothetical protein n=1 Tax=Rhizobium leguminosarum TaxID=384 RepID=UPI003F99E60F